MAPINDLSAYVNGMEKSLVDKMFFLKYLIDIERFVDFGCADGTLLKAIHDCRHELKLFGIDMSDEMLKRCHAKVPTALIFRSTNPSIGMRDHSNAALNLGSVLHEVYSYSLEDEVAAFWKSINQANYKYIFIRDMVDDPCYDIPTSTPLLDAVYQHANPSQLRDFENRWGSIKYYKNFVHYLLKYRYKANWEREVQENYLPITFAEIKAQLNNYQIVDCDQYTLPFLRNQVEKDFGFVWNAPTHLKAIFINKKCIYLHSNDKKAVLT